MNFLHLDIVLRLTAFLVSALSFSFCGSAASTKEMNAEKLETASRNLERSVILIENAILHYSSDTSAFSMTFDPIKGERSENLVSIWEYTSGIEAVAAAMNAMIALKESGDSRIYDGKFLQFGDLLAKIVDGMEYYRGTFLLTSYTGTARWSPYGVHRADVKGEARVNGKENVYDDQMWIVRELINAWSATGNKAYLDKAEYLVSYVLDGWDCTLNAEGRENGGITWGPGYISKHACSNGPMVSPLVWLHNIYKGTNDIIAYGVVDEDNSRAKRASLKTDYYLDMAVRIYEWQKKNLLREDGVYDDFMGRSKSGGRPVPEYEMVRGERYRCNTVLDKRVGPAYSYNSGTMLSGAADLYEATRDSLWLNDVKALTDSSFEYFAKLGGVVPGLYAYSSLNNNPWFNDVLLRGYIAAAGYYPEAEVCVKSFQDCLDYAWDHFLVNGTLPVNLLGGWNEAGNDVNMMFTFARAAEFAGLATFLTR